jgi:hypothetical protein
LQEKLLLPNRPDPEPTMKRFPCQAGLLMILTAWPVAVADGQEKAKSPPDPGRVLATAIEVAPGRLKDTTNLLDTKNYVFRGRVISLGKDRKVTICYDTEHLRVAGAWVGAPLVYSADKNMGPSVDGTMIFSTKPGPGWAKDCKWDDPREGKEGPLPRDWAHYKGLYLHGDRVVLSYTVGDMDVLEMPVSGHDDAPSLLVRYFRVGPTKAENRVLVCQLPNGKVAHIPAEGPAAFVQLNDESWLRVLMNREGIHLEQEDDRLFAMLPPSTKQREFSISVWKTGPKDRKDVKRPAAPNFDEVLKGGPARWTETLETTITPGDAKKAQPYILDQIGLPEQNPWNASIRFAGLDFFPDGRAALCTWDGDVWIVSGLNDKLGKVRWKRFAAGLQQPLGLKIINGVIYTAGRDQITKLHDLNGDGEADFYENLNNDPGLTLQRHEYVMDLQTDKDGYLYYCRSGHYVQSKRGDNCCVYKLSPDGLKLTKFARGFREPNGMSIAPDGTMTISDNEGNGIPQTPLYRLKEGADYGFVPSKSGNVNDGTWKQKEPPILWLGPKIDTSAGGQVWAPPGWGPLGEHLLHTSYGNCALFGVLIDKQAEPWQGAVWKFPLTFSSGIMRARFHPVDKQLYLCGLRGWGTSAVRDGQFCRVRSTGESTGAVPVGYRIDKEGIVLEFSTPLDSKSAEDTDSWAGTWTAVLKKTPKAKEVEEMPIASVQSFKDRKQVLIRIERFRPVPNFTLQYQLRTAAGEPLSGEIHGTIHRVP